MVRFSSCLLIALAFLHYLPTSILADNYVVVVIDDSGSMDESMSTKNGRIRRINAAKNALRTVLSNLSPDTKIGLLALNQEGVDGNWLYPLALVDREKLLGVVNEIGANGGTPLGHAMKAATDALLAARDKDPFGTFRLLVVTDGEATDAVKLEQYLPDIVRRGITIDVIGVDMQKDHSLATKVHQYRRADDAEALNQAVAAVFAESDSATDKVVNPILIGLPVYPTNSLLKPWPPSPKSTTRRSVQRPQQKTPHQRKPFQATLSPICPMDLRPIILQTLVYPSDPSAVVLAQ